MEVFPGLGYYFIVFRALESAQARERFRQYRTHSQDESAESNPIEGAIGAVNVYLIVFKQGICSVGPFVDGLTESLKLLLLVPL